MWMSAASIWTRVHFVVRTCLDHSAVSVRRALSLLLMHDIVTVGTTTLLYSIPDGISAHTHRHIHIHISAHTHRHTDKHIQSCDQLVHQWSFCETRTIGTLTSQMEIGVWVQALGVLKNFENLHVCKILQSGAFWLESGPF